MRPVCLSVLNVLVLVSWLGLPKEFRDWKSVREENLEKAVLGR